MSELSPESRALLEEAGDPPGPSGAARARMRRGIAAQIAIAGAASAAAASVPSAGIGAVKIIAAVAITIGAAGATWWALADRADAPREVSRAVVDAPASIRDTEIEHPMPVAASDLAPVVEVEEEPAAPPPIVRRRVRRASVEVAAQVEPAIAAPPIPEPSPIAAPRASTLEEELLEIRAAHAALRRGDPAEALRAADRHASRFADGVLRDERQVVRVEALCALGRTADARRVAQQFLANSPRSPQAGRVRASCGGVP